MKVFQFFINPNLNPDEVLEIFCFEPRNIYEKKVGKLFFIGKAKGVPLTKTSLLKELADFSRENFYKNFNLGPENAFKEMLKASNELLEKIKGEIRKINLLVFSWKDWKLRFSIVGEMKIRLIRGGKIYDLNKKLKEKEGLGIFEKMVSGETINNDLILVSTKEIFELMEKVGQLEKIAKNQFFNEIEFKKFLENKKEELKKISGLCFFLQTIQVENKLETKKFSLFQSFHSFFKLGLENLVGEFLKMSQKKIWQLLFAFLFFLFLASILF